MRFSEETLDNYCLLFPFSLMGNLGPNAGCELGNGLGSRTCTFLPPVQANFPPQTRVLEAEFAFPTLPTQDFP